MSKLFDEKELSHDEKELSNEIKAVLDAKADIASEMEELSDELMALVSGGRGASGGDGRDDVSEVCADKAFAEGAYSDVDGWDDIDD